MMVGFENAQIQLDAFKFERPSAKFQALKECLSYHYLHEFIRQAYKFLGSPFGVSLAT